MYRVLIVDDEPWVAYGISKLISWKELGFTIIGEAYDGITAMSIIEKQQPEVVISDIRMPGLDGIELLSELRKRGFATEVILVSGYSEFEYAQQALRYGAFDYLLKQIDKDMLVQTANRLKIKLEDKLEMTKEPHIYINEFFDLLDADHKLKIHDFVASKGKFFEHPHYRFVSCQYPYVPTLSSHLENQYSEELNYLSFRTGQNKTSLLVNYNESGDLIAFLDMLTGHLSDALHIGISTVASISDPITKLYQEADVALFSSVCQPALRAIEYKEQVPVPELASAILQLEIAIKQQKAKRTEELLRFIYTYCVENRLLIDQVTSSYNQIVALIQKYYGYATVSQHIEYLNYYQAARYGSYERLFEWLQEVLESQGETELKHSNEQIKEILDFIDARYTEDLILADVAKNFKMSLGYLSSLIKKTTGTLYSEYITTKRIQLAKELLADSTLSVQDVVQRVGYKDYFHFNKLFKKHVGLTPSKFRKL